MNQTIQSFLAIFGWTAITGLNEYGNLLIRMAKRGTDADGRVYAYCGGAVILTFETASTTTPIVYLTMDSNRIRLSCPQQD